MNPLKKPSSIPKTINVLGVTFYQFNSHWSEGYRYAKGDARLIRAAGYRAVIRKYNNVERLTPKREIVGYTIYVVYSNKRGLSPSDPEMHQLRYKLHNSAKQPKFELFRAKK